MLIAVIYYILCHYIRVIPLTISILPKWSIVVQICPPSSRFEETTRFSFFLRRFLPILRFTVPMFVICCYRANIHRIEGPAEIAVAYFGEAADQLPSTPYTIVLSKGRHTTAPKGVHTHSLHH